MNQSLLNHLALLLLPLCFAVGCGGKSPAPENEPAAAVPETAALLPEPQEEIILALDTLDLDSIVLEGEAWPEESQQLEATPE